MVRVAQVDRASDCGSEGRGFESRLSPFFISIADNGDFLKLKSQRFHFVQGARRYNSYENDEYRAIG